MRDPAAVLFVLTLGILASLVAVGVRLPIGRDDAIRHEVRRHATSIDIDQRIATSLKTGDAALARSYADLQDYMGWPISAAIRAQLRSTNASTPPIAPNASGDMAQQLGTKTDAVVTLTGKNSLSQFERSLGTIDFLVEHIVGFGAWLLALFGLALGQRIVPFLHA
jgi:hypothetical protein